ncbi:helix-turn-helix domain-containing protein [Actinokineospora sp.]|uniref:helix-turn-helix domain-containing protein n=1 Tax=Actinokineospora sp. TaxID=1872133 RepID=UPI00403812CC
MHKRTESTVAHVAESVTRPGFGTRLRAARRERGLAQKDLAGPGVSMSYVSRLESGDRVPSLAVVAHLADILGVEPNELTGDPAGRSVERDALRWCEATLAYIDGDADTAIDLLGSLGADDNTGLFAWSAHWLRAVLLSGRGDAGPLLDAADELRAGWSPGPAVTALVEILRARALWKLAHTGDAVRAARAGVDFATSSTDELAGRVRVRAMTLLCSYLVRTGRLTEAEQTVALLSEELDAVGGGLLVSAWWVQAQVKDRVGEHDAARASIQRACTLVDGLGQTGPLRARVLLAATSIALRSPVVDLAQAQHTLDRVEADPAAAAPLIGAQIEVLRGELALHRHDPLDAWLHAERALAAELLDREDTLRCLLLRAKAAGLAGDPARLATARESLRAVLDHTGPNALDPVLWRDIAQLALSSP